MRAERGHGSVKPAFFSLPRQPARQHGFAAAQTLWHKRQASAPPSLCCRHQSHPLVFCACLQQTALQSTCTWSTWTPCIPTGTGAASTAQPQPQAPAAAQQQGCRHHQSGSYRLSSWTTQRQAACTATTATTKAHGQKDKHTTTATKKARHRERSWLVLGEDSFFLLLLSVSVLTCVTNATHRAVTFPIGHPLREGSSAKEHRSNTQARRKKSKRKETYTRPTDAHTQAQSLRMKRQGCCHGVLALGKQL